MGKKTFLFLITTIALFLFISFISADGVIGLLYNSTWSQNLTGANNDPAIAFGDIDGNGYQDLIIIGCASGNEDVSCSIYEETKVYTNNGTTFQENQTWQQNLSSSDETLLLGDIDNDGDLDLILPRALEVYTNNGTTFQENQTWQQNLKILGLTSRSVGLGDIDNDGDLDLAFTSFNSGGPSVYLNNGTSFLGKFWLDNSFRDSREAVDLVDFDGDGYLDLISAGLSFGALYNNNGSGFNVVDPEDVIADDHVSLVCGDLDNDGDIDAIEMGFSERGLENNGTTLIRNTSWEIPGTIKGSLSLGDYDNDGDLDLFRIGNNLADIFDNNGTTFEANGSSSANITEESSTSTAWIDIDNDGDLDLAIVYTDVTWIYTNNITTPNTLPTPPNNSFSYSYNNQQINLGWLNGSDAETGVNGLYYNLKLGTLSNNHSIISGIYGGRSNPTAGYFGNMMQRKNITLNTSRLSPSTTYYWSVQTIDTGLKAGNWSEVQNFTTSADLTAPEITINSPVDNANLSSYLVTFNVTVSDNMNLSSVGLWGNWTGSFELNETNTSGINATYYVFNKSLAGFGDGKYSWLIQAKDNETNEINSSLMNFTIDTTVPTVVINSPSNSSYNTTSITFNITATDSLIGVDSCWYSLNAGTTNTSLENFANNYWNASNSSMLEIQHTINFYCNDSSGNLNNTESVMFRVDTTAPLVSLLYPTSTPYTSVQTQLNYSASDTNSGVDSCWYSLDSGATNISVTCGQNVSDLDSGQGSTIKWTIYVNDSAGNANSSSVTFEVDSIPPTFTNLENQTIALGANFSYDINATDAVTGVDNFIIDDTTNFSINSEGLITNKTILIEYYYVVNVSVTDNGGNSNWSLWSVNVTPDTSNPNITINAPSGTLSSTNVTINISFSDNIGLDTCKYNVTSSSGSTLVATNSITCGNNSIEYQTISAGSNRVLTAFANDTVGNINVTNKTFTISIPSSPSGGSPGGGGGSSGSSGGGESTTTTPSTTDIFDVDFSSVDSKILEIAQGDVKTFSFQGTIKHSITIIALTSDSITLLITSDPITAKLNLGDERDLDMNKDGLNDLRINLLSISGNKAEISLAKLNGSNILAEEEIEKTPLFDVKVSLSNLFNVVKTGREIIAQIEVFNVNNIGQVDVFVEYYITSKSDNSTRLAEGSDTLAIEAVSSFVRTLTIPYDLKEGSYLFNVDVSYNGDIMASGNTEFLVIKTYEIIIFIGVFVLIVFGILFYLWRLSRKEKSLENKVKVLKKSMGKNKIILIKKKGRKNGRSKNR